MEASRRGDRQWRFSCDSFVFGDSIVSGAKRVSHPDSFESFGRDFREKSVPFKVLFNEGD